MFVKIHCKKCGKDGYFDIGDLSEEEAKVVLSSRKETVCYLGGHKENLSPVELFEFGWDANKDHESIDEPDEEKEVNQSTEDEEEEYVSSMKLATRYFLTREELETDYRIESTAFGGYLCSSKDDEEYMVLFSKSLSPAGVEYYYA